MCRGQDQSEQLTFSMIFTKTFHLQTSKKPSISLFFPQIQQLLGARRGRGPGAGARDLRGATGPRQAGRSMRNDGRERSFESPWALRARGGLHCGIWMSSALDLLSFTSMSRSVGEKQIPKASPSEKVN